MFTSHREKLVELATDIVFRARTDFGNSWK
jgi:hypothetical protein